MFFPFSLKLNKGLSSIIQEKDIPEITLFIKNSLKSMSALDVRIKENKIVFHSPFGQRWNVLSSAEGGKMEIEKSNEGYSLSYSTTFFFLNFFFIVFGVICSIGAESFFAVFIFFSVFLINNLISFSRHRTMFYDLVDDINFMILKKHSSEKKLY